MPTSTSIYFLVVLFGLALQYACDSRCIAETARQMHLSVTGIRWPIPALRLRSSQRCYRVRVRDQHGRVHTRLCSISGVIGLPMEVALEPSRSPASRR